jgi:hypothetical protein
VRKVLEGLSVLLILLGIASGVLAGASIKRELDKEEYLPMEAETEWEEDAESEEAEAEAEPEPVEIAGPEPKAEPEPVVETANPSVGHLAYDLLDEETQQVYQDILNACEQHLEKVELRTVKEELLATAYQAVTCDYGGLFWVSGYTYTIRTIGDQVASIEFAPNYVFSQNERIMYQSNIDAAVEEYLSGLDFGAPDYEKVKWVYEQLIEHVTYKLDSKENQNILSVFLYGESVCNGYASAAQYLLTLLDVPCMLVYGTSEGQNHAWNLVYVNGEPYYLDCTWGSTVSASIGTCSYNYLDISSRDIAATHQLDMLIDLPECVALEANYYVREDRFFTDFDEAVIGNLLRDSYLSGDASIAIKFSSDEIYRQVLDTFITNMKTMEYCRGLESVSYVEDEKMRILTFVW